MHGVSQQKRNALINYQKNVFWMQRQINFVLSGIYLGVKIPNFNSLDRIAAFFENL